MNRIRPGIVTIALSLVAAASAPARAEEPRTAAQLVALAPVIDEGPVEVEGRLLLADDLAFSLRYLGPGRYRLVVTRLADGCPVLAAVNGRALLYDPLAGTVRVGRDAALDFRVDMREGGEFKVRFGWNPGGEDELRIDFPSIVGAAKEFRAEALAEGGYRLAGRSARGNVCAVRVRPGDPLPYRRLVLAAGFDAPPPFRIEVRPPAALEVGDLPSEEELGKVLRVEPVVAGLKAAEGLETAINKALLVFAALREPERRPQVERMIGASPDWAALAKAHETAREALGRLVGAGPATGARDRALRLAAGGDDRGAFAAFEEAAAAGDLRAQTFVAEVYLEGGPVKPDPARGIALLEQAATNELAQAQWDLGRCREHGVGGAADPAAAFAWYRRAADHGFPPALQSVALCLLDGVGVDADPVAGARWMRQAATAGLPEAQLGLGMLYRHGIGVEKDAEKALTWMRMAAERPHPPAQQVLGRALLEGDGVAKDEVEGAKWVQRAAEAGLVHAAALLGQLYRDGRGVARSVPDAYAWLKLAAGARDKSAVEAFAALEPGLSEADRAAGEQRIREIRARLAGR